MKRHAILVLCCGCALLVLSASAQAVSPYFEPPPFDPQRTICWEFTHGDNPLEPYTLVGPEWDSPGWECDEVRVEGDVRWYDMDPAWPGRQGLVGIENDTTEMMSGKLIFHVNNYPDPNWFKLLWDEAVYFGAVFFGVVAPDEFDCGWDIGNEINLENGGIRDNLLGVIYPNPEWEEFVWTFDVAPGEFAYLDSFCVSTLCVPEPATVSLLVIGSLMLCVVAVIRRKR